MGYHVIIGTATSPAKAPTDLEDIYIATNGDIYVPHITEAGLSRTFSWVREGALPGVFVTIPTADPHVAGQVWNDAGTLKASAG